MHARHYRPDGGRCCCSPPAAATPSRRRRAGRPTAPGGPAAPRGSARDRSRISRPPPATACSSPTTSSDISPEAQQILQRQAQWLRRYPNVSVTIEGQCRRARHARVQPGARRAPRAGGQERAGRARHPGGAHLDDQLRQGAARDAAFRRAVLCAEPPRRHDGELTPRRRRRRARPIRLAALAATPSFCPKPTLLASACCTPIMPPRCGRLCTRRSECSGSRSCRMRLVCGVALGLAASLAAGAGAGPGPLGLRAARPARARSQHAAAAGLSRRPAAGGAAATRRSTPKSAWTASKPRCAS